MSMRTDPRRAAKDIGVRTINLSHLGATRRYSIIDKVSVAETLFRDIVVTSYAHEHITQQAVRESGLQAVYADILKFVEDRCAALCSVAAQLNITACDFVVRSDVFSKPLPPRPFSRDVVRCAGQRCVACRGGDPFSPLNLCVGDCG